jgi:hypothetical protein
MCCGRLRRQHVFHGPKVQLVGSGLAAFGPQYRAMRFDVSIAHEAACTRVGVIGEPTLGRLLSLLQVLEVDSAGWPGDAVLLDLRGLRSPLAQEEQGRIAAEAARTFRRMKRIAVLAAGPGQREAEGVRFFDDPEAALNWFA